MVADSATVSEDGTGGGILVSGSNLFACDDTGVHEWTGEISPNKPDDP